jgi:uncharacterized protein YpbB
LVKEGLDLDQIVEKRGLKQSTIEGHFAKGIEEGAISIEKVLDKDTHKSIHSAISDNKALSMNEIYVWLDRKYSYGQIRMVFAQLKAQ